jgi:hypothetical protein
MPAGRGVRQVRAEGIVLIGDPHNDSHLFVLQLHLATLRLHNLAVDHLRRRACRRARSSTRPTGSCRGPTSARGAAFTLADMLVPAGRLTAGSSGASAPLMRTLTAAPARS